MPNCWFVDWIERVCVLICAVVYCVLTESFWHVTRERGTKVIRFKVDPLECQSVISNVELQLYVYCGNAAVENLSVERLFPHMIVTQANTVFTHCFQSQSFIFRLNMTLVPLHRKCPLPFFSEYIFTKLHRASQASCVHSKDVKCAQKQCGEIPKYAV